MEENKLPAEPINFMDKVRDKIKNSFVELVPDEQWEAMVKQEMDAFFTEGTNFTIQKKNGGWNQPDLLKYTFEGDEKPSFFRSLVWDECIRMTRDHLQKEYINNIMTKALEERASEIDGETTNLIKQAVPIAINTYFENIARNMMMTLQQSIQNNSY